MPKKEEKDFDFLKKKDLEEEDRCLHMSCKDCHGTGKKKDGSMCIHYISCPCKRCTPRFL